MLHRTTDAGTSNNTRALVAAQPQRRTNLPAQSSHEIRRHGREEKVSSPSMRRAIFLPVVLTLIALSTSQARLVSEPPPSLPSQPSTVENACTPFFEGSEPRIGLLCHNDPINKTDPFGLADKVYEGAANYWSDNYNPTDRISMVAHGNATNGAVTVVNGKTTGVISASTIAKDAIKAGYSESKNQVELAVCEGGVGGKNSLAQKVANELYKQTGIKPDVAGVDGKTANPASKNDSTGKITSGPLTGVADPAKGQSAGAERWGRV